MAYKTLIFGKDNLYEKLKPLYDLVVKNGNLDIVAYAVFENENITFVSADGKSRGGGGRQPIEL